MRATLQLLHHSDDQGRPRSVELHQVLASVDRVVAAGFKEIALSGVHLGSYGTDLNPALSLFELLRALDRFDPQNSTRSELLFRISSLEPMDCTPEIVNLVADSGRFAPHFHLPLQHASDRILASMRRPYYDRGLRASGEQDSSSDAGCLDWFGRHRRLSRREPRMTLPSFAHARVVSADSLHVFPYSDRPGTAAAAMGGKFMAR